MEIASPSHLLITETQSRVCRTCGLEKTIEHFISLYTDSATHNCDYCRCRQRQQYKEMQQKKKDTRRKLLIEKANSRRHTTTEKLRHQAVLPSTMNHANHAISSQPLAAVVMDKSSSRSPTSKPISIVNKRLCEPPFNLVVPRSLWIHVPDQTLTGAPFAAKVVHSGIYKI